MARACVFQMSLLCIFSFVPWGGRAPLNSSCRFLFYQMAAHRTTRSSPKGFFHWPAEKTAREESGGWWGGREGKGEDRDNPVAKPRK